MQVQVIGDCSGAEQVVHCWWYRYRGGAKQVQSTCRGSDEATDVQVQRCRGAVVYSSTVVQRCRCGGAGAGAEEVVKRSWRCWVGAEVQQRR